MEKRLKNLITLPFIWVPLFSIIVADIFTEIFHRVSFPLYGIPLIERRKYIKIDRHKLKRLTFFGKLSCVYCGYVNGWLHYASVIAGETERYWCGIRHKKEDGFIEPRHHAEFDEYDKYA